MNNLSVGVYGDSFANMNNGYSWVSHLNTKHRVINYGKCGNSVYQCFNDYLQNNLNHPYNIFVIPTLQRFYSQQLADLLNEDDHNFDNWFVNFSSMELARNFVVKNNPSDLEYKIKIIDSVMIAVSEWIDFKYITESNTALVDKIRKDKNLILLDTNSKEGKVSLTDLSIRELNMAGYKETFLDNNYYLNIIVDTPYKRFLSDIRTNHFSEENNRMLGDMLLTAIDNNFCGEIELSYDNLQQPQQSVEHYLQWTNL
jgi:hypothetical protein